MPNYPVGKTRLGYGRIGDKFYNLDDEEERKQYFEDNRKREENEDDVGIMTLLMEERSTDQGQVQVILFQLDYLTVSLY